MQDPGELREAIQAGEQFCGVEIIGERAIGEAGALGAVGEIIDRDHIAAASGIEGGEDIGADKARGPGQQDHGGSFRGGIALEACAAWGNNLGLC